MGCCGSKVDDLPLVIRCRERKDLLKAAADHRYALAAAHLSYFISLKDVGEALRKFVDEELVYTTSSSSTSSPVVTFHTIDDDDEEDEKEKVKKRKTLGSGNGKNKSKSESESKSLSSDDSGFHHGHGHNDDDKGSHLHLSDDDSDLQSHVHLDNDDDDEDQGGLGGVYGRGMGGGSFPDSYPGGYSVPYGYGVMNEPINQPPPYWGQFPYYFGGGQPYQAWAPPSYDDPNVNYRHTNVYYMKRSSPVMKTVIHEPRPATNEYASEFFRYPYENEGFYGVPTGSPSQVRREFEGRKQSGHKVPADPPPPPSPKGSTWDFLDPFDAYDNGISGYFAEGGYGNPNGYGSSVSSPDSAEVRKREGIPDLEEETENEVYGVLEKGKKVKEEVKRSYPVGGSSSSASRAVPLHKISEDPKVPLRKSREGDSKSVPLHRSGDGSSRSVPMQSPEQNFTERSSRGIPSEHYESTGSVHLSEELSSSETILSSKSPEDVSVQKKEVSFEVDETPKPDVEFSKLDNLTALSTHGTRDLREVVAQIRDEFANASDYGKEVALMLEVGKLPYQHSLLKGMV